MAIEDERIRDTWVLIFSVIAWTVLFATYISRNCFKKKVRHSRSNLLRSEFAFNIPLKNSALEALARHSRSHARAHRELVSFIFEEDKEGVEDGQPRSYRQRTFDDFRKARAPPAPCCSFQLLYDTSKRAVIYCMLLRGALPRCFRFVAIVGVLAMTLTWVLRNDLQRELHSTLFSRDAITGNILAAYEVQKILLPLASFLLALYINNKMAWFDGIIKRCWSVQGDMASISLIVASILGEDLSCQKIKFEIYRYLNLIHFFLYKAIAVDMDSVCIDDLIGCGLMTVHEAELLRGCGSPRCKITLWLGRLFSDLCRNGTIDYRSRRQLMDYLNNLRADGDALAKELAKQVPISFAQLLQLMIDILLLLTPAALSHVLDTNREGVTVYLWPAFGSMIVALFYQGGMKLITVMEYPFGLDLDDLHPQWALMAAEAATFGYLAGSPPDEDDLLVADFGSQCSRLATMNSGDNGSLSDIPSRTASGNQSLSDTKAGLLVTDLTRVVPVSEMEKG